MRYMEFIYRVFKGFSISIPLNGFTKTPVHSMMAYRKVEV